MEDSVAAKSKLPTKMFFISSSCLSIVRLASADLDLSQVGAGLSKGSFSIAGHCQGLLHRAVPNLLATGLAFRPFHSQGHRVVAALGVLVNRVLLRRAAPVAKIPLPGRHLAGRLIAEGHHPAVQIDGLETPV